MTSIFGSQISDDTVFHLGFRPVTIDSNRQLNDPVHPAIRNFGAEEVFFLFFFLLFASGFECEPVTCDRNVEVVFFDAWHFGTHDERIIGGQ